ncbi:tetratricopeptide repeat protein [Camelimonas sp. ID_303_24]
MTLRSRVSPFHVAPCAIMLACVLLAGGAPVARAAGDGAGATAGKAAPRPDGDQVDRLFERLGKITDEEEGAGVARRIEEQWLRSGSATADLLMRRAVVATLGGDHALGVELLDRVIVLRPGWAEAWNRRAALFTLLGDDQRAAVDLQRALTLEPRHYQALAALGVIFSRNEDSRNALKAWRRSLALNPFQPELKQRVDRLAPDVDGRDL